MRSRIRAQDSAAPIADAAAPYDPAVATVTEPVVRTTSVATTPLGPGRRWIRPVVLVVALAITLFAHLHRLGTATALLDELTYQQSGIEALRGNLTTNASPYLARHLFGVAQLVIGEGLLAARLVSALASILTGLVLYGLARRLAGWWAGVGALVLWSVLPQATRAPDGSLTMVKLGRSALLEPVMALFVILSLALCWRWLRDGRTSTALLTGAALGAGVASKPTAALVLPVLVVCVIVHRGLSRRLAAQIVGLGAAALVVVAASYLPLGTEAPGAVSDLVEYQAGEHADDGHPVIVAGTVYDRAPWWAHAWWQWRSLGTAAAIALGLAALAALRWLPPTATGLLAGSIAVPAAYLSFFAAFGLPHYLHLWQPALVLLGALGIAALVERGGGMRLVGGTLALVLALVGVQTLATVATTERRGYGAVGDLLEDEDLVASSVVVWGQTLVTEAYLPGAELVLLPAQASKPILAVIVDPGTVARDSRPDVEAYLAAEGDRLVEVQVDHLTVYVRR